MTTLERSIEIENAQLLHDECVSYLAMTDEQIECHGMSRASLFARLNDLESDLRKLGVTPLSSIRGTIASQYKIKHPKMNWLALEQCLRQILKSVPENSINDYVLLIDDALAAFTRRGHSCDNGRGISDSGLHITN